MSDIKVFGTAKRGGNVELIDVVVRGNRTLDKARRQVKESLQRKGYTDINVEAYGQSGKRRWWQRR